MLKPANRNSPLPNTDWRFATATNPICYRQTIRHDSPADRNLERLVANHRSAATEPQLHHGCWSASLRSPAHEPSIRGAFHRTSRFVADVPPTHDASRPIGPARFLAAPTPAPIAPPHAASDSALASARSCARPKSRPPVETLIPTATATIRIDDR
ncbi:hypothetical protein RB4682 [Rhodopirellula baltica SH 1]|uniref:Uncharacterized protein n=1 Tax=Rhodopirellula baltica (strain DSM 10527 / NCIMB 13988 / SH1) TaxID=243090 RepID=Q7US65_RHOBA|nr:hypothetical protein RB4682 [Rhodopirellula baltica SH 1]